MNKPFVSQKIKTNENDVVSVQVVGKGDTSFQREGKWYPWVVRFEITRRVENSEGISMSIMDLSGQITTWPVYTHRMPYGIGRTPNGVVLRFYVPKSHKIVTETVFARFDAKQDGWVVEDPRYPESNWAQIVIPFSAVEKKPAQRRDAQGRFIKN